MRRSVDLEALGRRSHAEVAIDRDAVDYIDVELADGRQQPVTSGSRSPESRLGVRSRSVGESVNLILHPGGVMRQILHGCATTTQARPPPPTNIHQ